MCYIRNQLDTSLLSSLAHLHTTFANTSKSTVLADIFIPLNLWLTTVISFSFTLFLQFVLLRLYFSDLPSNDTVWFFINLSNGVTSIKLNKYAVSIKYCDRLIYRCHRFYNFVSVGLLLLKYQ